MNTFGPNTFDYSCASSDSFFASKEVPSLCNVQMLGNSSCNSIQPDQKNQHWNVITFFVIYKKCDTFTTNLKEFLSGLVTCRRMISILIFYIPT